MITSLGFQRLCIYDDKLPYIDTSSKTPQMISSLRGFDLFCWRMDLHLLHSLSGDYLQFRSCFPPGYIPTEKINNNCFPSFPFQPEKINRSILIKRRLYPQTAEEMSPKTKCHQKSPSTIYIYSWYINSMRDMKLMNPQIMFEYGY